MLSVFYSIVDLFYRVLRVQTLGVKGVIFSEDKKLLLVKHSYRPGWHLPGGRVNAFESVKCAVVREVLEEAGVLIDEDSLSVCGIHENFDYGRNDHVVVLTGFSQGMKEGFKLPNMEIIEAGFFSLDALPSDVTESTKKRLDALGEIQTCPW